MRLFKLLALLAGAVGVRALSAVLADVAGALGVLAGLLRIRTGTRHYDNMTSCQRVVYLRC